MRRRLRSGRPASNPDEPLQPEQRRSGSCGRRLVLSARPLRGERGVLRGGRRRRVVEEGAVVAVTEGRSDCGRAEAGVTAGPRVGCTCPDGAAPPSGPVPPRSVAPARPAGRHRSRSGGVAMRVSFEVSGAPAMKNDSSSIFRRAGRPGFRGAAHAGEISARGGEPSC